MQEMSDCRSSFIEERGEIARQESDRLGFQPVAQRALRRKHRLRTRSIRAVVQERDARVKTPAEIGLQGSGRPGVSKLSPLLKTAVTPPRVASQRTWPSPTTRHLTGSVVGSSVMTPVRSPSPRPPSLDGAEPPNRATVASHDEGSACGTTINPGTIPSPVTPPPGVHVHSARAIAPALAPKRTAPPARADAIAAHARVPGITETMTSGSPPGKTTMSAAARRSASTGSEAVPTSTTIAGSASTTNPSLVATRVKAATACAADRSGLQRAVA